jgi:hypothetical protein
VCPLGGITPVLLQQAMCVVRSEESLQATCVSSGSLPRITPNPTSVTELLYTLLSCLFALAMYTLSMLYMCVCVIYLGIRRACDFTTKNPAPPAEEQIGEKDVSGRTAGEATVGLSEHFLQARGEPDRTVYNGELDPFIHPWPCILGVLTPLSPPPVTTSCAPA